MGTYYVIKYLLPTETHNKQNLKNGVDRVLERVNEQMSTYLPDSEISRFNSSREINQFFPVSAATVLVVNEALRIHQLTDGGLDITLQPLVNLWGFGPEKQAEGVPTDEEIAERKSWTGIDKLMVEGHHLIKKIPQLALDLSAIAKGYGVDAVAEYLQSQGIERYLVDIGGEVRAQGKNAEDKFWRIAIEKPGQGLTQEVQRVIELDNKSVATSGNYRNYFENKGVRYSHTLDPKTGQPITHQLASITVIADSCMTADGLATGLGVLGPEQAMALANKHNIPVLMIVKTDQGFVERYSQRFTDYQ